MKAASINCWLSGEMWTERECRGNCLVIEFSCFVSTEQWFDFCADLMLQLYFLSISDIRTFTNVGMQFKSLLEWLRSRVLLAPAGISVS